MNVDQSGGTLPSVNALKAQAKRLRAAMIERGTPISQAVALEATAKQWGYRDWNTASAMARSNETRGWHVGQRVQGHYLGHLFAGQLKAVRAAQEGVWYLTVIFDEPVDVVASKAFNSFRKQVNVCVNSQGQTHAKTSNGVPHMELRAL